MSFPYTKKYGVYKKDEIFGRKNNKFNFCLHLLKLFSSELNKLFVIY